MFVFVDHDRPIMSWTRLCTFAAMLAVSVSSVVYMYNVSIPYSLAAGLVCPFVDGDGLTPGIQVTGNVTIDDVDDGGGDVGDFYDCTASLVEIKSGITVTLGSNTATGGIAEIHFSDLEIESGAAMSANELGCPSPNGDGFGPNGSNICLVSTAGYGRSGGGTTGTSAGAGYGGSGGRGSVTNETGGITYGSATAPVLFGSSAGTPNSNAGGTGGGVVRLDVSGTFTHNGTISANGRNGAVLFQGAGGGSGGSVYITTAVLEGTTGTVTANGGNGGDIGGNADGGGGGGGRIAIECASGSQCLGGASSLTSTDLTVTAGTSGTGAFAGTKGTVYVVNTTGADDVEIFHGFTYTDTDFNVHSWLFDTSATNQYCDTSGGATPSITVPGDLTFDGTLNCATATTSFTLTSSGGNMSFAPSSSFTTSGALIVPSVPVLTIGDGGTVAFSGAMTMTATSDFQMGDNVTVSNTARNTDINLNIPDGDDQVWTNVVIDGASEGDLVIDDIIALTLSGTTSINSNVLWTELTDLTIDAGASILAIAEGCVAQGGNGFGPDGSNVCAQNTAGFGTSNIPTGTSSGGGYGGGGGAGSGGAGVEPGGVTYGSATAPLLYGSSSGTQNANIGGSGGGLIRIIVADTLTNNGTMRANGGAGTAPFQAGGGGSGGSVFIVTDIVAGSTGVITTIGGAGADGPGTADGGGGGGGRIAIEFGSNATSGAFLLDAGADTIGGTGAAVYAAGGSAAAGAVAGSSGSLVINQSLAMASAVTADNDGDGQIDRIIATFTEDLDGTTVTGADFTVTSPSYTVVSASETAPGVVTIILTESGAPDTDETPTVNIVGSITNVGATSVATDGSLITNDDAAPVLLTRETADVDADGQIDAITLTYSEPISDATLGAGAGGFAVSAYVGEAIGTGATPNDGILRVSFTEGGTGDTDATPTVTYTPGTVADPSSNLVAASGPTASTDEAAPIVTDRTPASGASDVNRNDNFAIVFSEPMDEASTEAAFDLTPDAGGFAFSWDGTSETLTVDPAAPLTARTLHTIEIANTAQSAAIGDPNLPTTVWTFTTAGGGGSNQPPSTGGGGVTPTIHLTSPNGGEVIEGGAFFSVTWTSTGNVPLVTIDYTTDNGATWIPVVTGTQNDGVYSWDVPRFDSDSVLLRIIGTDGAVTIAMDGSDQGFSIDDPLVNPPTTEPPPADGDPAAEGIPEGQPGSRTNPRTVVVPGTYVRTVNDASVYYITPELTRIPIIDARTFFTIEDTFGVVTYVTDEVIQSLAQAMPQLPEPGTILITFWGDPRVYVIMANPNPSLPHMLRRIESEEMARTLAGVEWRSYVVDYNTAFKALFVEGPPMFLGETINRNLLIPRDLLSAKAGMIHIEAKKLLTLTQQVKELVRKAVKGR